MRKSILMIILSAVSLFAAGCGGKADAATMREETRAEAEAVPNQVPRVMAESTEDASKSRVLIAYFTRAENIGDTAGVDAVSSASLNIQDGAVIGNVKLLADDIQSLTGGDLFAIQTERTYLKNYRTSTDEARAEQNKDERPALKNHVENIENYDVIYVGYPNWWGTVPMAVNTFLEEYDLTGKMIIPFSSHEGSGLGSSMSDIRQQCKDSEVLEGLAVRGRNAADEGTKSEVENWLKKIGQLN